MLKKIAKYIKHADSIGLDMVIFPELALMGYPIEDTIDRHPFIVQENIKWLNGLAKITKNTSAFVGFVEPREKKCRRKTLLQLCCNTSRGKIKGLLESLCFLLIQSLMTIDTLNLLL